MELETKIIVEAEIIISKRFGGLLKNSNYGKALEDLYDEVVTVIESS